ncbi:MAG: TIGR01777 family oxidoreductase [Chitinophagales bacterium]
MAKVLITGGTGLLGNRISQLLREDGHEVHILSRSTQGLKDGIHYWNWNIKDQTIQDGALKVDHIIHLAGAGIADKRWTAARKKELIDSRVKSTELLLKEIKRQKANIISIACASAVGYYGDRGADILHEDAAAGKGFLSEVCVAWEKETSRFSKELSIPTAQLRIGIVLSNKGGALPKLSLPIKFGAGAYMGNGKQFYPWIHIDDVSRLFIYAIQHALNDVYNACAPHPCPNKELSRSIAKVLNRPFIPLPAPERVLQLGMGEMSAVVLNSQRTSSDKIEGNGFEFKFPDLEDALKDIFERGI